MGHSAVTSAARHLPGELVRRRTFSLVAVMVWVGIVAMCAATWALAVFIAYEVVR